MANRKTTDVDDAEFDRLLNLAEAEGFVVARTGQHVRLVNGDGESIYISRRASHRGKKVRSTLRRNGLDPSPAHDRPRRRPRQATTATTATRKETTVIPMTPPDPNPTEMILEGMEPVVAPPPSRRKGEQVDYGLIALQLDEHRGTWLKLPGVLNTSVAQSVILHGTKLGLRVEAVSRDTHRVVEPDGTKATKGTIYAISHGPADADE